MAAKTERTKRQQILGTLFPGEAERDSYFRDELSRLSRIALVVIGGVQIGVSVFMLIAHFVAGPDGPTVLFRVKQAVAVILLGLVSIGCSRSDKLRYWWRAIAALSGLLTAAVLIWASLLVMMRASNADDFIPGQITLVMLVAVAVVPLMPIQTLALGIGIGAVYVTSAWIADHRLELGNGANANYVLFIVMLTLLCTGISAVSYQQRWANFELRVSQARIMLAENATSLARLAAALSHELNNPMGAMLSGIDTLLLLASKQATVPQQDQARLVLLQADVRKSIQQSSQRLKALVSRMQRFTNLDKAEVQDSNLNELITDVAALMESQLPRTAKLELDLQPIECIVCRPQQISAVFSNLLSNAASALNGDDGGCIVIATRQLTREVEVQIRDNGRGVDPAQLRDIFEPTFKASGDRVQSANWGMFSARQIVREHGGDIKIESNPKSGTTVRVSIPSDGPALT